MIEEHLTPQYERRLKLVLNRIDPKRFGNIDRKPMRLNNYDPTFKLTQKNKELLLKYYKKMCNENIALTRQHNVLGVLARLLEILGKDFETATRDDIEELIAQINSKTIGPITRQDYLKKIKQLDRWINGGEEWSQRTKWIKTGLGKKHSKLPSQLITPDEAKQLINVTDTVRDRALIHLMWESGARIGEIINLNINSVQFDKGEARIRMKGKVGERQILLLESVHDLKEYYKTRNAEPDDPLFIQFGTRYKGAPITHQAIGQMLHTVQTRTEIKKRIYAYLFRHSRASYLASQGLNKAQLCMIFGWTIGSKQPATYIHLSGAQVENAYKKLYGLKKEEQNNDTIIKCEVCGEMNPSKLDTCNNCYNPLTIQGALKIKQEKELLQQDRDISQQVFAQAVKLMTQKNISVEDAQKQAIQMIAAQQIQNQKTGGG